MGAYKSTPGSMANISTLLPWRTSHLIGDKAGGEQLISEMDPTNKSGRVKRIIFGLKMA